MDFSRRLVGTASSRLKTHKTTVESSWYQGVFPSLCSAKLYFPLLYILTDTAEAHIGKKHSSGTCKSSRFQIKNNTNKCNIINTILHFFFTFFLWQVTPELLFSNLPSIIAAHQLFWQEVIYPMLQEVRRTKMPFDPLKLKSGCLQVWMCVPDMEFRFVLFASFIHYHNYSLLHNIMAKFYFNLIFHLCTCLFMEYKIDGIQNKSQKELFNEFSSICQNCM